MKESAKREDVKVDGLDEKGIEEEVKSTRSLIQTFLQTVKAYRLYEAGHPILSKFLERTRKDFANYFEEFDSFSLQVKERQLFCRGNVVYESQDMRESLAFAFYKDGIREIRFYRGLEDREVTDFLNIVRKSDHVNRSEDDLVTLFWERTFSHIDFTTVDEFLEGSGVLVPATEEDLAKKLEYHGNWDEGWTDKADSAEPEQAPSLAVEGLKQALPLSPGQSLVQACQLSPAEREEISRRAQEIQEPEHLYVLIDNLIEILLHLGEDIDAYENMISFFQRTIESLLDQGEVKRAVGILNHLTETMEAMVLRDKQIFAIRRILEGCSSPKAIECLGKNLKREGDEVRPESIQNYLQFVTKQAIDPLCLLLGQLESGKWRMALCNRLAELAQTEIQPLTRYLSDPNPALVCQILSVLGKVGHPSTLRFLGPLVTHSELKVREETLKLVARHDEKGKDLLQRFLKDTHPEIRTKASLALAKAARGQALKPLTEIILSEEFFKRSYEEKASFFKAVSETGSQEAIPFLEKIAKKKTWFQKAKWSEMRQCASMALKMMSGVSG